MCQIGRKTKRRAPLRIPSLITTIQMRGFMAKRSVILPIIHPYQRMEADNPTKKARKAIQTGSQTERKTTKVLTASQNTAKDRKPVWRKPRRREPFTRKTCNKTHSHNNSNSSSSANSNTGSATNQWRYRLSVRIKTLICFACNHSHISSEGSNPYPANGSKPFANFLFT